MVGALRREKMADNALQNLVAEIEHMNRLVRLVTTSSYINFYINFFHYFKYFFIIHYYKVNSILCVS